MSEFKKCEDIRLFLNELAKLMDLHDIDEFCVEEMSSYDGRIPESISIYDDFNELIKLPIVFDTNNLREISKGMKHCKHKDNCKFPKCNCSTEKTTGI